MSTIQDKVAIAGIGRTPFGKGLPESETVLAGRAVLAALADAGIDPSEVDAVGSYTMESTEEVELAKNIGAGDITFFAKVGYGGGAGCAVIGQLAMAIATGQADVAVAWRSRKRAAKGSRPWAGALAPPPAAGQWTRPAGLLRPVDEIAVLARRYMTQYGASRDHLANVALAARAHAQRNPAALTYGKPLDRDEYMSSRWISEPLCLYDNCLESDGALACVLVSAERAADCPQPAVLVHAFAQGLPRQHETMTNYWTDEPLGGPARACAARLWSNAAFGPQDLDCAQIYDAFTPLVLLSLEGYGICPTGEAGPFTDDGALALGGALPTNTSGGGLSEAYVHGFNLITEGVRQMRGTSTAQVDGARTCLVTSGEGVPTSALLLTRP